MYVTGDASKAQYQTGFNNNELSFWASTSGINEMRMHLYKNVVDVRDLRVLPQPLKKCNPLLDLCHGEIILDYKAYPYYNAETSEILEGTGLVVMNQYKPRTTRFTINPKAFFFDVSDLQHVIIGEGMILNLNLPTRAKVIEVNPLPDKGEKIVFPNYQSSFSWTNSILVDFYFVYEVEKGLDEEIIEFFSGTYKELGSTLWGIQGLAIVMLVVLLFIFYVSLTSIKSKKG